MATALTSGYIYFLESDAADNQNWLHDPETIDLDNFTEGTDFCKIERPLRWRKGCAPGVTVIDGGSGKSFDILTSLRRYSIDFTGITTTTANALLIDSFVMSDRHTLSGSRKTYHMVIKYASNNYEEWSDSGGTRREYCTGAIVDPGILIDFLEQDNLNRRVSFAWRSTW